MYCNIIMKRTTISRVTKSLQGPLPWPHPFSIFVAVEMYRYGKSEQKAQKEQRPNDYNILNHFYWLTTALIFSKLEMSAIVWSMLVYRSYTLGLHY